MIDRFYLKSRKVEVGSKDYLTHASDRLGEAYILTKGMIVRERTLHDGCRQIVGFYVAGDICNLDVLISGRSLYDLRALTPATYLAVDRKDLMSAAQSSVELSDAIRGELAREMAIASAWIVNLGLRSAFKRIAHLACEIAARWDATDDCSKDTATWPGNQTDLASVTGLSVVHVNRTLMRLVAEKVLSDGRTTIFHDMAKLKSICSFEQSFLDFQGRRLAAVLFDAPVEASSASVQSVSSNRPLLNLHALL